MFKNSLFIFAAISSVVISCTPQIQHPVIYPRQVSVENTSVHIIHVDGEPILPVLNIARINETFSPPPVFYCLGVQTKRLNNVLCEYRTLEQCEQDYNTLSQFRSDRIRYGQCRVVNFLYCFMFHHSVTLDHENQDCNYTRFECNRARNYLINSGFEATECETNLGN